MVDLKWKKYNLELYQKETPAQVFSCELCNILQNSFFEEHRWTAVSDLRKCLKALAIIIVFEGFFWIFGSERIWKPYLKNDIVWQKLFPEKYIIATYIYTWIKLSK